MSFLNPLAFLWTGLLAAGLIALYLLRMRRKDLHVPATFLWPERTDEVRANSLFQKLRFSWLLVLQLLALLLVGIAWAQPQLIREGLGGEVTAIVIDASASMNVAEGGKTRFELAVQEADGLIAAAEPGDRLCLILAGPQPRVIFPLTSDKPRQRAALRDLASTDADTAMSEALQLAAALVGSSKGSRIVVLSDGVFGEVEDFSPGDAAVSYVQIGKELENLGIEALGASDSQQGPLLYAAVRNYGSEPQKSGLRLFADGELIDSINFEVLSGENWSRTISAPAGALTYRAEIDNGGALKADDKVFAMASGSGQVRILLVGPGDLFMERALALEPNVVLDKAAQVPPTELASAPGPGVYDIVIFDGVPSVKVKARGVLAFGPAGGDSIVTSSSSVGPARYLAKSDHAIMDGVDLGGVYIETMTRIEPTGTAFLLAEAQQGPLVVAQEGARRHIHVAFEPLKSDFPLSVSFPIFLANAIQFLAGQETQGGYLVQPGQTIAVNASGNLTLTSPEGEKATVESKDGRAVIRTLNQVGEWTLTGTDLEKPIYVSLKSPSESSIAPKESVSLSGEPVEGRKNVQRLADAWKPLALIALLILAVEWWLFARRS